MGKTKIEWATDVWNPVTGCDKVSQGCKHCYAEAMAERLQRMGNPNYANGFKVTLQPHMLEVPLRWKRPRIIFVNSMSDLFHEDVPDDYINKVFAVMAKAKQHTFQVLTKRSRRMMEWSNERLLGLPLPDVWLGVSVEDQKAANERIPHLLQTPAAVRFLSCEPLLGPVDIGMRTKTCSCCEGFPSRWVHIDRAVVADFPFNLFRQAGKGELIAEPGVYLAKSNPHGALSVGTPGGFLGIKPDEFECLPALDWVIAGGESGPKARPMHPDWVRSLRDQCVSADVPFFFKQWGRWVPEVQCPGGLSAESTESAIYLSHDGRQRPARSGARNGDATLQPVGKKKGGRMLDGRTWDEFPASAGSTGGR